eukprot:TRINITY_DN888_c0_g2_i1.p1 TRINITY_DN888_c0_g2~~TRINITY_DN888_c0_g2_i1.p1  ORF type:complete len:581 (-),score=114.50 TRINITY_DN888_c0_g2_i1:315-2057(-)
MAERGGRLDEEASKREITRFSPRYVFSAGERAKIGTGGFGDVLIARDTQSCDTDGRPRKVAIKCVGQEVLETAGRRIVNELMLLRQIHHENVVCLLDCFSNAPPQDERTFTRVYLVFEWVQNDLKGIIYHKPPILARSHTTWILYQLFLALNSMHRAGVVHRDITPTNVLINPQGTEVKVIDLGLSRVEGEESKMTSYVTQRWYRAPEVVMAVGHNTKLDMWSAGTVLAEMLRLQPLFRLESSKADTDARQRCLRAQQLVRLLVVIGPPDQEDIDAVRNESVKTWLTVYRDKVRRRTDLVMTIAQKVIADRSYITCSEQYQPASADEAIRRARDYLGNISASQGETPDATDRIRSGLAYLRAARVRWGAEDSARLGDPSRDILEIVPHFTGLRPSLRQELPAVVDPEALDLLTRLLSLSPHKRPSATEALRHPFLSEWYDPQDEERGAPDSIADSYTLTAQMQASGQHFDWRRAVANEIRICRAQQPQASHPPQSAPQAQGADVDMGRASGGATAAPPAGSARAVGATTSGDRGAHHGANVEVREQFGEAAVPMVPPPPPGADGMDVDQGADYPDDEELV